MNDLPELKQEKRYKTILPILVIFFVILMAAIYVLSQEAKAYNDFCDLPDYNAAGRKENIPVCFRMDGNLVYYREFECQGMIFKGNCQFIAQEKAFDLELTDSNAIIGRIRIDLDKNTVVT